MFSFIIVVREHSKSVVHDEDDNFEQLAHFYWKSLACNFYGGRKGRKNMEAKNCSLVYF